MAHSGNPTPVSRAQDRAALSGPRTARIYRTARAGDRAAAPARAAWAAELVVVSYGARLGIRVADPRLIDRLPPHLPPRWRRSASARADVLYALAGAGAGTAGAPPGYLLYRGESLLARERDGDAALAALESELHRAVALHARHRLFVHAGVVGWRGRAIVVPGRSRSGKSTLIAALVRAGATYYSDEYAVFDALGRVHPYPKPLSLRGREGEPARRCPVEALGGRAGARPLPLGLVVLTAYRPHGRWRPRALSPGQAVLALLENTVLARGRPAEALRTLGRAVEGATALRSPRKEVEEVVTALLR